MHPRVDRSTLIQMVNDPRNSSSTPDTVFTPAQKYPADSRRRDNKRLHLPSRARAIRARTRITVNPKL